MCDGCPVRVPRPVLPAGRVVLAGLGVLALAAALACSPQQPSVVPSETPVILSPDQIAGALTDEELVGQVLMLDLNLTDSPETATAMMEVYQPGGVILMGNGTAQQVRAFTQAVQEANPALAGHQLPALVSVDQEYGFVRRISDIVQLPAARRPERSWPRSASTSTTPRSLM